MFEIAQHTADIRIHITASSVEELFADAVLALMESMEPVGRNEATSVTIEVDAPDLTALLVDFLNDLLLRCHTQRVAFEPVAVTIRDGLVVAEMRSIRVGGFEDDVKAVTYHEAEVRQLANGSWVTALVLDV
jgi:SHS2 domain-containing protein